MAKHRSGSRKCSNSRRKPQKSQMPTSGVTAASSHVTKLSSAFKTSCSVNATLVTPQVKESKKKKCPAYTGTHVATGSNGERGGQCNPLVSLSDLKDKVEVRFTEIEKTLANYPISTSMLQAKIDDLDRAWFEFETRHHWLSIISGRGRLQGLQAYHAALKRRYWAHIDKAEDALEEEQAKETALKKLVIYGQKIAAWE